MQEIRLRAAGTACARAQVLTLRERLLKLGARVMVSVRRWVIHLPTSFPFLPAFRESRGIHITTGTSVDAAIIHAPSPPRTGVGSAIRRCTRRAKESSGTSG